MGKKSSKKRGNKKRRSQARNGGGGSAVVEEKVPAPLGEGDTRSGGGGAPGRLQLVYPDSAQPAEPLPPPLACRLTKLVMEQLKKLNPNLDLRYWKGCTRGIFSADARRVQVIPARAGAGKSTWIRALLLTLCRLHAQGDPLADCFGGILLVIQKVEDLNQIADQINREIPGQDKPLMIPLQSLTPSGRQTGRCRNNEVQDGEACPGERCPYASDCDLLRQQEEGKRAYLLGATQARFSGMRQAGRLDGLLSRLTPEGKTVPRRLIIFDEKPDLYQLQSLSAVGINQLSSRLERLGPERKMSDRWVSTLQFGLNYHIRQPFEQLRRGRVVVLPDGRKVDQPAGFCGLDHPEASGFEDLREQLICCLGAYNRELQACLPVMEALYRGEKCLFCKEGGFRIFTSADGMACLEGHRVLVFDATAEVDGDYQYQPWLQMLSPSPPREMGQVCFHIFAHAKLNVSQQAMDKPWIKPGLCALTEELLKQFPGKTFFCSYKKCSGYFAAQLSSQVLEHIPLMPNAQGGVPYFGGTNGSNVFRTCSNVILVGYPRLDPGTYLERCYAAWKDAGMTQELESLVGDIEGQKLPWQRGLRSLPMVAEYEIRHLAARLEQEIYRCALRNPENTKDIHIVLFAPPDELLQLLTSRFPGCQVKIRSDLPDCIARIRSQKKTYRGKPTALAKLHDFLAEWDGSPIRVGDLYRRLEISDSAWKELRKDAGFSALLLEYRVTQSGRGGNSTWHRDDPPLASQVPA